MRGHSGAKGGKAAAAHRSGKHSVIRYKVDKWQVEPSFVDRQGTPLEKGVEVSFHSYQGNVMRATVMEDHNLGRMVSVRIADDPFPVFVDHRQLQTKGKRKMARVSAPAAPTAKELRRQAKNAGVVGWEEMSREELQAAIDEADVEDEGTEEETPAPRRTRIKTSRAKTTTKAEKTTKKAAKAAPRPKAKVEGPNPFRPGSNLHKFTEQLMVGGKRSALVKKLLTGKDRVSYSPRVKSSDDFDEQEETDRRLKVIGYILRDDHGFEYEHEGRGPDAYIRCTPPPA